MKTFKHCPLEYLYTYEEKFVPVEKQPIWVQSKGLVLHETFEALTLYENYPNPTLDEETGLKTYGEPVLAYRKADLTTVMNAFKTAMENNDFPIEKAEEYQLKLGLKRWLSFKHDYLDKRNHKLYAEKRYEEILFGETKTITILDLMEDCGDGNYIIYDYKTPKSIDLSRYKDQLLLYAYTMACVKGLIEAGSEDYETVVNHFKVFVFFPLVNLKTETYEKCLQELTFNAEDLEEVMKDVKKTCDIIDGFDFSKPAEVLQVNNPNFQCKWCSFCGSKPQPDTLSQKGRPFEGCPITNYLGMAEKEMRFEPVLEK